MPAPEQKTEPTTPPIVTSTTTPPASTPPATEPKSDAVEPSLLSEPKKDGEPKPAPAIAPEKYEFKAPDGYEVNPEVIAKAEPIFKELGLTQAQADKLFGFYSEQVKSVAEAPLESFRAINKQWADETLAHPDLGPRIDKVKENISRALDSFGDAKLTADFKHIMDMTGAGNNVAFVRVFDKLASAVNEGKHVPGTGPSRFGQAAPGAGPTSVAKALYPNNP